VAHFNETVARGDSVHWVGIKIQPNLALALWQQGGRVPSAELLAWKGEEEPGRPSRYHLSGWLLYHYLWDSKLQALSAFEARLGRADDPASAWTAVFPEYDPARIGGAARLDAELDAYLRGGLFGSYMVEAPFDSRFNSTPLTSPEVRALLLDAQYSRRKPENGPTDLAIAEAVLREDPTEPLATYAKAGMQNLPVLESLRRSVESHPGDWRAWFLLAQALRSGDVREQEAAYRRSLELNPDCPQTNNDFAWLLYEQHRPKEAQPFAERAVALSPSRPNYLYTLAAIADAQGRCSDALRLVERAAGAAPTAASIQRPLGALRAKCGSPSAPAREAWEEFPKASGL
jgi:Flp pilus assembly protein TadD